MTRRFSSTSRICSSSETWNGSPFEAFSTVNSVAAISISPVARFGFSVPGRRGRTRPRTLSTKLAAQAVGGGDEFRGVLLVDDDLYQSRPIPQVDEHQVAKVALTMRPSVQDHFCVHIRSPQGAAGDGSFPVVHNLSPSLSIRHSRRAHVVVWRAIAFSVFVFTVSPVPDEMIPQKSVAIECRLPGVFRMTGIMPEKLLF